MIELRGRIKTGTVPSSPFTLPTGYRPPKLVTIPVVSNDLFGAVSVSTAGVVTVDVGSSTSVNLDGIEFDSTGGT